jgi:hypothetical protein
MDWFPGYAGDVKEPAAREKIEAGGGRRSARNENGWRKRRPAEAAVCPGGSGENEDINSIKWVTGKQKQIEMRMVTKSSATRKERTRTWRGRRHCTNEEDQPGSRYDASSSQIDAKRQWQ